MSKVYFQVFTVFLGRFYICCVFLWINYCLLSQRYHATAAIFAFHLIKLWPWILKKKLVVIQGEECVKCWGWENGRNERNYTQTVRQNVENNLLFKHVLLGLPSAGLSSHCRRLDFKTILAAHVFPLCYYSVSHFWLRQCSLWQNLILSVWLVFRQLGYCLECCRPCYIRVRF